MHLPTGAGSPVGSLEAVRGEQGATEAHGREGATLCGS